MRQALRRSRAQLRIEGVTIKVSEEEFLRAAAEAPSVIELSRRLGLDQRNVRARGKRIEQKTGARILPNGRPDLPVAKIEHSTAVYSLQITDGTILVGSDAHIWPGPLSTMQRAFVAFAKKLKPTAIIANGDFFDGAKISRWPSIGWEEKPEVRQEIEALKDYMRELIAASPQSLRIWPMGNHDQRFETRLAAAAPEYRKMNGVHLKDHFPEWVPCWRVDVNREVGRTGGLVVRHRENGGEHADWNNVLKSGVSMVTGHDHRTGVTPYRDYNGMRWGVRCGYMADSPLDPQFVNYLEAREPSWHPAFVLLTFRDGRLLWPELINKHDDGHVEFRGDVIPV